MTPPESPSPAKGLSNTKNLRSAAKAYQTPPASQEPTPSSSKIETETVTLTLSEYGTQLRAQFVAGKEAGIRSQEEKYKYFEEDMKKLVSVARKMTDELFAESWKEREYQQNLCHQFEAGKQEGMRLGGEMYKEYAHLGGDMKNLVLETIKMKDEVLEEIKRQGGSFEDVVRGERNEVAKDLARESLKGWGENTVGGKSKAFFRDQMGKVVSL